MDSSEFEGKTVQMESDSVTLGEEIGSGNEGSVYRIRGTPSAVVKIFNDEGRAEKAPKVRAMIDNEPKDPTYEEEGVRSIIWPQAVVEEPMSGSFLGYKMPYKDLDEAKPAFEYAMVNLRWDASTEQERLTTALNLAIMVHAIHREGHAIGDFNHDNILIDDGFISLIDCDAFHISGANETYPDVTYYPRYSPPEGRGDTLVEVQEADRFCLGVHIFQFLMEGHHPYQAQGPEAVNGTIEDMLRENKFPYEYDGYEPHDKAPDYYQLPSAIRALFEDCFSESGKNKEEILYGNSRPEPPEWIAALGDVTGVSTDVDGLDEGTGAGDTGDLQPKTYSGGGGDEEGDELQPKTYSGGGGDEEKDDELQPKTYSGGGGDEEKDDELQPLTYDDGDDEGDNDNDGDLEPVTYDDR